MKYILKRDEIILEELAYHRGIAEEFEKDLVSYLNLRNTNAKWNIKVVGNKIIDTFPNIIEAQHIGSSAYNIEGDILLITESKAINIEIKMSEHYGKGTLANISQKIFKAINTEIESYQDFHNNYVYEDTNFKNWCWTKVGDAVGKKIRTASEYQTFLRNLRDSGSYIVDEIVEQTNFIKIEYNEYLISELLNTPDYLHKLTLLVRLLKDGIHTYADIKNEISELKPLDQYKQRSEYYVVYVYNVFGDVSCQIVDYSEALDTVHDIESNGQSIVLKNSEGKIIVRFSTHWKNICQGGATPCFNVFHGNIKMEEFNNEIS